VKELLEAHGPFYHVTCRSAWVEGISQQGLDPRMGAECCAGRSERMTFLCTRAKLATTIRLAGTKFYQDDELAVIRIEPGALVGKNLSADVTFGRGIQELEASVRDVGNLGCFDAISADEITLEAIIDNPEKANLI